ncbi:MAG TPA: DUF6184 family natural product biosynthesis lipoprotein [Labilithrix sp.]|jgi:hypothetical protein|nr:DUF6184 family natural product biosynthesis lipoprotein [Labilithrix sp.]
MRRAVFMSFVVAGATACGRHGNEARTTTITGATMITSGPGVGEPELLRTLDATSQRLASEVCVHQSRCGHADASSCIDATLPEARAQLMSWNCDPAAIRARLEECLAGINEQSCEVDMQREARDLCPGNVACRDRAAGLIDPGPELAKVWQ